MSDEREVFQQGIINARFDSPTSMTIEAAALIEIAWQLKGINEKLNWIAANTPEL